MKLIICKGIPASGKSTWARKRVEKSPNWVRVNRDDLRNMRGRYWLPKQESMITQMEDACIEAALSQGLNVILDATNLNDDRNKARIDKLRAKWPDLKTETKFFEIDPEEAIKRDLERPNSVGEKVIWRMYYKLHPEEEVKGPQAEPIIPYDENKKDCIICDLDGTLALFKFPGGKQSRNPFDASKCDETDVLNKRVYEITQAYKGSGVDVILLSGRSSEYREPTLRFLENNKVRYDGLYMRATGDNRKDSVIKQELWETYVKYKYNVILVLDDRDQMIELWRNKLGFTTFQVANGDF